MKLHEIFYPELNAYVKFKVLTPQNIDLFTQGCGDMHPQEFRRYVVDNLVYNLKSELFLVLRKMDPMSSYNTYQSLYYGCLMLNPSLDYEDWIRIAFMSVSDPAAVNVNLLELTDGFNDLEPAAKQVDKRVEPKKIPKSKLASLKPALLQVIVGQEEAVDTVADSLKRSIVGLEDKDAPIGVFLFCGSSGVGKTEVAKQINTYLFGKDANMVRIDCGQFQEKHDTQRLFGSPTGYVGYEDGGLLTNEVANNPNTVVLLDEVEKAHPDFWNAFLNVFDDGFITNNKGVKVDFRNTIIILTTNLGNSDVLRLFEAKNVGFGDRSVTALAKDRVDSIVTDKVKEYFRPELLNRVNEVVVFNHLSAQDLAEIAVMELEKVAQKLSPKGIRFEWDDSIVSHMVDNASSTRRGARGMAGIRRKLVEGLLADAMMANPCRRGTTLSLVADGENFKVNVTSPQKRTKSKKEA